jgi:hemolysin activation/secretion protein
VESPFDDLDIESDFLSGGVELSQPLWHTLSDEVRVGLLAEWRRGRNTIDGYGFSFSDGPDRGVSIVAPLRPFVEWVRRGRSQVFAVRGQLSVGLPVLGYTDVPGAVANGTFVVGLLQAQWARRFDALRGIEVVARTDLQVSADPLLPIEQFALGGHASVRGYREDELVADNGFDASLELRLPLWRRPDGTAVLQLAPFADVGRAWEDEERPDAFGKTLASVGLGLRWFPWPWLRSELYWGYRIEHVPDPHDSLQDQGLQFRVVGTVF